MAAPSMQPVNFFAGANPDLYARQLALQQQQALAEKLMEQGSEIPSPSQPTNPGGFVPRLSPLTAATGAGKMLAGAMMQRNMNKQQAELAGQQMQAMIQMLRPKPAAPPPAAPGTLGPLASPGISNAAADAVGAPWAAQSQLPQPTNMSAPAPQPQAPQSEDLVDQLMRIGAASQFAGPAGGAFAAKQMEPTELQRNVTAFAPGSDLGFQTVRRGAFGPPIAQRANAPIVDPATGKVISQPVPVPAHGQQITVGPGGPVASVLPGFPEAQSALSEVPLANAPMQTIKLSNQRELQLTQPEYLQYVKSGGSTLPSRYSAMARELPGMQFQDASTQPGQVPSLPAQGPGIQGPRQQPAIVGATQSQSEQVQQARQTAGGKAADEAFAKDYVAFRTGGAQDATKQLAQLHDVIGALANPQANLTGPALGRTPDVVKAFTNPQSIAMRERVEEVVQRSLRAILGAQFTEREGERLIARAYNPNLPEKENTIRVNRLFTQLQQAFEAKQSAAQFFERNGTLDGWAGKLPSIADFDPGEGAKATVQPLYATNPQTKQRITSTDGGATWKPAR